MRLHCTKHLVAAARAGELEDLVDISSLKEVIQGLPKWSHRELSGKS